MQARSPQREKEERQTKTRVVIKQPPPEEKHVEYEEASLGTQAIMRKDDNIATLAYALYEQRGRKDGRDLDDWLEAEQRLVSWEQDRGVLGQSQ